MVEAIPVCTVARDVPVDACGNRKREESHYSITPLLHYSITPLLHYSIACPQGTARNFWRIRSSGYWGKKTSAIKTLFGVSSRVAIVSLYSIRS